MLHKDAGECRLVIVGDRGWRYEQIFRKVQTLGLEDRVQFWGYVPDSELPLLYRGAECSSTLSLRGVRRAHRGGHGVGLPRGVLESLLDAGCRGRGGPPRGSRGREGHGGGNGAGTRDPSLADALRTRGLVRAQSFRWEDAAKCSSTCTKASWARRRDEGDVLHVDLRANVLSARTGEGR